MNPPYSIKSPLRLLSPNAATDLTKLSKRRPPTSCASGREPPPGSTEHEIKPQSPVLALQVSGALFQSLRQSASTCPPAHWPHSAARQLERTPIVEFIGEVHTPILARSPTSAHRAEKPVALNQFVPAGAIKPPYAARPS
jgi:hypothetical protein